ncbi:flavin reductase family protein [Streptomyces anulatus]|uniref:flavin reductase family protein n=1 Tax=Streptomyces anulatus TaxID=1892 RepID=UPI003402EC8E
MTQTITPSVTPAAMRRTLAGFATGLSVVAAGIDGQIVGMPANSLASVSLDPPLVSLAFAHTSTTWPVLRRAPRWGISVLGEAQTQVLQDLRRPAAERFGGIEMNIDDGAAFVLGALATIAVTPRTALEAGDHTLVLLEVKDLDRDEAQRPLVFFDSTTHTLSR